MILAVTHLEVCNRTPIFYSVVEIWHGKGINPQMNTIIASLRSEVKLYHTSYSHTIMH